MAPPWQQEKLDHTQSEKNAHRPSAEAERVGALDLVLWLLWTSDIEQLTLQVRDPWLLQDVRHIVNGTRTMADIIFDHGRGVHSPPAM